MTKVTATYNFPLGINRLLLNWTDYNFCLLMGWCSLCFNNREWHCTHNITDYTDPPSVWTGGRLWLSPHTHSHKHIRTLSIRLKISSWNVFFSAAHHLPSDWKMALLLRSDWLLYRWLYWWPLEVGVLGETGGFLCAGLVGWCWVTGSVRWLVGWFECQEWRNQGAKIRAGVIDLTPF